MKLLILIIVSIKINFVLSLIKVFQGGSISKMERENEVREMYTKLSMYL